MKKLAACSYLVAVGDYLSLSFGFLAGLISRVSEQSHSLKTPGLPANHDEHADWLRPNAVLKNLWHVYGLQTAASRSRILCKDKQKVQAQASQAWYLCAAR